MVDLSRLCLNCFKDRGDMPVCHHCGYAVGTATAQSCYLQPGMILTGRYIIGTVIGVGGFGITYRAYDAKLDMVVAIKEFYPSSMVSRKKGSTQIEIFTRSQEDTYQSMLERFLEEAKNMAVFAKEPDIVTVYDYFEENGTAYIVMEYIEGILLKDYLREYGAIPQKDAVPIILDLLQIGEKLHKNKIIHKDISPDNLFLLENNKVKLFDFGAANFQGKNNEEYHEVVIKAGYAPPEQYRKDNIPAPTLDVYASGALLYEMLTGKCPLEATDRIIQDELVLPSTMGVEIDENLERIIQKAMALDPEQRFQSMKEFYDTIAESRQVEVPEPKRPKKRYQVIQWGLIGILSLTVVAAGIFVYFYKTDLRNYVPEEGTKLTAWMVQDTYAKSAEVEEMRKTIQNGFEERYPEVDLELVFVPEAEYEEKLKNTPKAEMPDIFCADYLEDSREKECADLTQLVKHLNAVQYLFEDEYKEHYPDKNQIPAGFQMAVYYRNISKEALPQEMQEKIEIGDVSALTAEQKCRWIRPEDSEKGKKKVLDNMTKKKAALNSVAGSLSCWSEVQKFTVSGKRSSELQIIPVVDHGKLLCSFKDAYAVRNRENKNQQKSAMLFLYYLLGNSVQRELSLKQNDMLPVNAKAYREYMENLSQYKIIYIQNNISVTDGNKMDISISSQITLDHSGDGVAEVYGSQK